MMEVDDSRHETVQLRPFTQKRQQEDFKEDALDDDYEYDPHVHRQLDKPTSNWETLVHLLKCSLGTGILAMPQAYARSGLVTGVIGTVLAGVLVTHCLHMLVGAQYNVCKRLRVPLISYPGAMRAAIEGGPQPLRRLSRAAEVTVDLFLLVYQLGICCVYIVFIADNIKKIVDPYYTMAVELHMLVILFPLIAFNLIPSLKLLAPFSALANLLTFLGLGIIVYYLLSGSKSSQPLDLWGSAATFPLFFGTILFALTAVGVVVALENNMATPSSFVSPFGVLNSGMTLIVVVYICVGVLGYLYCVSECSDSITLDLPSGPLASSVIVMFAIAIFISYGLHCFVPVEVVWRGYVEPRMRRADCSDRTLVHAEYALRVILCLITFVLAISVPRLGLFISLFGALCLSALGICFPAIMEMYVSSRLPDGLRPLNAFKCGLLIIIGVMGLVAGTYTAVVAIIKSFQPLPDVSHNATLHA